MSDATLRRARPTSLSRAVRRGAALAAVAVLALTACSSGDGDPQSGSTTTIRFTYATGDETLNAAVKALVEDFNATSETTRVTLDPLPAGSDYSTALRTLDAAGKWPALIDMREAATYINAGKLAPIPSSVTDLLDQNTFGAAEDGNVYVTPLSALNGEIGLNIVYDKDYFAEHDLEVPATYDDFISLMEAIQANGDVPLAAAAAEVWPSDQLAKQLAAPVFAAHQENGGFWNSVEAGEASIEDLREPIERLQYIFDTFVLDGWQSTADAQTTTLLVNHQAVMATSSAGLGRLNDINKVDPDFNAGLFIVPDDEGTLNVLKNSVNGETAMGIAISAQAQESDAEYAAAVEFLEYYYSVPAADLMEQNGMIAPNITRADEITRNTSIPGADDYFALLESPDLVWYQNEQTNPSLANFLTYFRQARVEMLDGQTTVDEYLQKSQAEFEKLIPTS